MGLKLFGVEKTAEDHHPCEQGLLTRQIFSAQLQIAPVTFSSLFRDAYVRRRTGIKSAPKLYSVHKVLDILSEQNGFQITRNDLSELVSRREAGEIIKALGQPRHRYQWQQWRDDRLGPIPIRIGRKFNYRRSDVVRWANHLNVCSRSYLAQFQREATA